MSELATLARPYAAAVFKRAKDTNDIDKWSQTLTFIVAVLSDESISDIVNNPKFSNQQISELILSISDGQIDKEGENFLRLLINNKRLILVSYIAKIFEAYKAEYEGYIDVDVHTAYPFVEEVEQQLISALERSLSKKVNIKVTVDASLIGGVLVRAGDRVIDGSIKGQLQHMQKALQ